MSDIRLFRPLWGNHAEKMEPKSNSLSPKEEQLAEYRETVLNQKKQILLDRRGDPLCTWKVAEWDPRFPNYDITNWCYTSFEDHYRCRKLRGDDYEPCNFFKNVYLQVCPKHYIERWENARANGTFLPIV